MTREAYMHVHGQIDACECGNIDAYEQANMSALDYENKGMNVQMCMRINREVQVHMKRQSMRINIVILHE